MFNLFGSRRKPQVEFYTPPASTETPTKTAAAVPAPAPVNTQTSVQPPSDTVFATTEQAVAVLEAPPPAPPPVEKPRELSPQEKLRLQVDGEAISFHDICATLTNTVQPRDAAVIKQEKEALEARLAETFAVEAGYRQELGKGIDQLKVELGQVELDSNYQRIDMGFLMRRKWSAKDNCPLPLFAAFSFTDPECLITATSRRDPARWQVTTDITCKPQVINKLIYADSLKQRASDAFEEERRRNYRDPRDCHVSIKAVFSGAIPNHTREKIKLAKPRFDEIFLVTEAPEWELSTVVVPAPIPVRDPLVIGRKGDLFWLIDAFDLTPLEAAIKGEWTSDKTAN